MRVRVSSLFPLDTFAAPLLSSRPVATRQNRSVAQTGSAFGSGPKGQEFKSLHPDHLKSADGESVFSARPFFALKSGLFCCFSTPESSFLFSPDTPFSRLDPSLFLYAVRDGHAGFLSLVPATLGRYEALTARHRPQEQGDASRVACASSHTPCQISIWNFRGVRRKEVGRPRLQVRLELLTFARQAAGQLGRHRPAEAPETRLVLRNHLIIPFGEPTGGHKGTMQTTKLPARRKTRRWRTRTP